jgi:hypothetical protein
MTAYNVLVGVVHVVEADDPNAAVAKLTAAVDAAGFTTYEGRGDGIPDVFESEPDSPGTPLPATPDPLPVQDLRALLDYGWSSEERDYIDNPGDRHIFLVMRRLDDWLHDSATS